MNLWQWQDRCQADSQKCVLVQASKSLVCLGSIVSVDPCNVEEGKIAIRTPLCHNISRKVKSYPSSACPAQKVS